MGEFGCMLKINKIVGREHYPNAGCVVMAGARLRRGVVIGMAEPKTYSRHSKDFATSIYHTLGIDSHRTCFPPLIRPTSVARGAVLEGIFAEARKFLRIERPNV